MIWKRLRYHVPRLALRDLRDWAWFARLYGVAFAWRVFWMLPEEWGYEGDNDDPA